MSCRDCVFRGTFQDMGASCNVCNLQNGLADAIKACEYSESCRHRFTIQEAKKIVIERESGLPVIVQKKAKPSEESNPLITIKTALEEVGKAASVAARSLTKAMQTMPIESEVTNERE